MNFPFSYFFYIFALVIYLVVTISLDAFKESPHLINNVYHTFAWFADGGRITTATTALVGLGLEYLGKVNSGMENSLHVGEEIYSEKER